MLSIFEENHVTEVVKQVQKHRNANYFPLPTAILRESTLLLTEPSLTSRPFPIPFHTCTSQVIESISLDFKTRANTVSSELLEVENSTFHK